MSHANGANQNAQGIQDYTAALAAAGVTGQGPQGINYYTGQQPTQYGAR
jgi:hypothetical protein